MDTDSFYYISSRLRRQDLGIAFTLTFMDGLPVKPDADAACQKLPLQKQTLHCSLTLHATK